MPKGNKLAYLNSPMYDNTEISYEDNKNMIELCLDVFHTKEPDLNNPDEVEKTISAYFSNCINRGLRPGNMGLYTVLGLTKTNVKDLLQGRIKSVDGRAVNNATITLIKKACKSLSLFRESLGAQGKLNPATLIFWQKNFDGLEDVQRVDVAPVNALQPERTPEELQKLIEEDIPEE